MQKGEVLNQMIAKEVFFNMAGTAVLGNSLCGVAFDKSRLLCIEKVTSQKGRFLAD